MASYGIASRTGWSNLAGNRARRTLFVACPPPTILFITHDLDEAVYLADRILILDAHPGRLREVMEVPVPRPRSADQFLDPTFIAARRHIEELIHPRAAQAADKLPLFRMAVIGDDVE